MICRHLFVFLASFAPAMAQQALPAQLEGIVADAALRAIPNCAITVEADGREVAKARSDGSGSFFVAKVPRQRVVVRALAGADVGAASVDLTGIDRGWVQVVVYPARTVRGRVAGADGKAVAGAWIVASPVDGGELAVIDAIAQSGADGRYELTHVLAGPARVRAWSHGREIFEGTVDGDGDAALDCELGDDPEREIAFVLRGANAEQLAAAELVLAAQHVTGVPMRLPPPLRTMRPDAEGRCVVRGWPPSDRLVGRFVLPGVTVVPPSDFAPKGVSRWTCQYDVQAGSAIAGILRREDGKPLAGLWLLCRPQNDDDEQGIAVAAPTAEDGRFKLPAPVTSDESFVLTLATCDYAIVQAGARKARLLSCHVGRHDNAATHEVVARPCGRVRLQVVDAQGQPVRGALVRLQQAAGDDTPAFNRGLIERRAGTAADGSVEFRGVDLREAGTLWCEVFASAGIADARCAIGGGEDVHLGTVAIPPAAPLAGIVLDGDGKPVVGARVQLMCWEPFRTYTVLSGRDGRFAFAGLRPGRYRYVVHRGGQSPMFKDQVVLPPEGVADLELRVK